MRRNSFIWIAGIASLMSAGPVACSLNDLLDANSNAGNTGYIVEPRVVNSYTGALGLYYSAIGAMRSAMSKGTEDVALFTDEMYEAIGGQRKELDARITPLTGGIVAGGYKEFQTARVQAAQASAALLKYGTQSSYSMVGNAYALQAHAITMLAELFCSGVPLTDVPLSGNLTYTAGLSTTVLLERAVALFDTAYQYGKDSLPIATFARIGKGRALVDLGRYAEARAAVAEVATTSQYVLEYNTTGGFWTSSDNLQFSRLATLSPEGGNGVRWIAPTPSQQDPRVPFDTTSAGQFVVPLLQQKYNIMSVNLVIADGIQGRMIEAEADLQPASAPKGPWLDPLNAARRTVGLTDTTDPGTINGRINLLFRERAFWFYLNGQRLGDMRRLIRQYGRPQLQVFPTGAYPNPNLSVPVYGTEVVFTPDKVEQDYNPLYKGCMGRGA